MAECSFNYYDRTKPKFLSKNYVAEADCRNGWTVVHASCTASQLMDRRLSRVCSVINDSSPSLVITCVPSHLQDLYQWKVLVISNVRWDNMMKSELNVCVLVTNTTATGIGGGSWSITHLVLLLIVWQRHKFAYQRAHFHTLLWVWSRYSSAVSWVQFLWGY